MYGDRTLLLEIESPLSSAYAIGRIVTRIALGMEIE